MQTFYLHSLIQLVLFFETNMLEIISDSKTIMLGNYILLNVHGRIIQVVKNLTLEQLPLPCIIMNYLFKILRKKIINVFPQFFSIFFLNFCKIHESSSYFSKIFFSQ
jgi:hypothetical protein